MKYHHRTGEDIPTWQLALFMVAAWPTLLRLILGVAPENVEDTLLPLSQTQGPNFFGGHCFQFKP